MIAILLLLIWALAYICFRYGQRVGHGHGLMQAQDQATERWTRAWHGQN